MRTKSRISSETLTKLYEKLKALTRGQAINKETIKTFVESLDIPNEAKQVLLDMTRQQEQQANGPTNSLSFATLDETKRYFIDVCSCHF